MFNGMKFKMIVGMFGVIKGGSGYVERENYGNGKKKEGGVK